MKKIVFLFVLALGLMSFTSSNNLAKENVLQGQTCCYVAITYNGEPAGSVSACIPGSGPTATTLACLAANKKAKLKVQELNAG
ncbi:MAG: hypothetical protein R2812_10730 [Gelidibacter sp.]